MNKETLWSGIEHWLQTDEFINSEIETIVNEKIEFIESHFTYEDICHGIYEWLTAGTISYKYVEKYIDKLIVDRIGQN
ncbi:hypothetical protein [Clostridium polynesiense]|uniref:hypothetical protein n=1 Tax=Clostridium polynesiense TaxID=1325933 RepID=UPI00058D0D49|nr:hypothetical protein [Clostridium polynesiense]